MSAIRSPSHLSAALPHALVWVWLLGLTVVVGAGYAVMADLAGREQVDSSLQQLHALEVRTAKLADTLQSLLRRPEAATTATLRETRETLDARIAQVEQALTGRAAAEELSALRTELEQIKARQTTAAVVAPRATNPPVAAPRETPLPFRVVSVELRAGQRAVSVAPLTGEPAAERIEVLLPGDRLGIWRLDAIDAESAVFRAADRTQRLALPPSEQAR